MENQVFKLVVFLRPAVFQGQKMGLCLACLRQVFCKKYRSTEGEQKGVVVWLPDWGSWLGDCVAACGFARTEDGLVFGLPSAGVLQEVQKYRSTEGEQKGVMVWLPDWGCRLAIVLRPAAVGFARTEDGLGFDLPSAGVLQKVQKYRR
jgi:hypothetical protein